MPNRPFRLLLLLLLAGCATPRYAAQYPPSRGAWFTPPCGTVAAAGSVIPAPDSGRDQQSVPPPVLFPAARPPVPAAPLAAPLVATAPPRPARGQQVVPHLGRMLTRHQPYAPANHGIDGIVTLFWIALGLLLVIILAIVLITAL